MKYPLHELTFIYMLVIWEGDSPHPCGDCYQITECDHIIPVVVQREGVLVSVTTHTSLTTRFTSMVRSLSASF